MDPEIVHDLSDTYDNNTNYVDINNNHNYN